MATIDLSTSKDEKMESQSLDFSGDPALDDIARQLEAIDKEFSSDKFSGAEFLDKIDDLERSVVNTRVEDYVTGFMDDASGELLTVSGLNKEAIANIEESRQKEKERSQLAKDAHARLLEDVVARRKEALKAIDEARRRAEEYVKKQSEHEKLNIRKAFLRAEKSLIAALKGRKGEVKKYYGDLQYSTAQFMGHEGRVYRVEWSQAPQPLRFKIHHLSCNKERLASGRYVLTVTLLDRLGGHVLRWSNTRDRNLFGVTGEVLRKPDDGWHTMIKQSIETVCPPEKSLLASMVFVWELFLLRGSSNAVDRSVGWGLYPAVAADMSLIKGKFKLPMLRGAYRHDIVLHTDYAALANDPEKWLGNLYFESERLSRYARGQKEFEVELQHTSAMLGLPKRVEAETTLPQDAINVFATLDKEVLAESKNTIQSNTTSDPVEELLNRDTCDKAPDELEMRESLEGIDMELKSDASSTQDTEQRQDHVKVLGEASCDAGYVTKKEIALVHDDAKATSSDELDEKNETVFNDETYHQSLQPCTGGQKSQLYFLYSSVRAEINTMRIYAQELWKLIFCFVIIFWLRTWIHYLFQWMYLLSIGVPVSKYELQAFNVALVYHDNILLTGEVVGVICTGVLGNMVVFVSLSLLMLFWQKFVTHTSRLLSLFTFAYGLETALDPILLILQDLMYEKWHYQDGENIGDAFKLYWHMEHGSGSGTAAVCLTIYLYLVLVLLGVALFGQYIARIHRNGSIRDVYSRLTSTEGDLRLLDDREIAWSELEAMIERSHRWRGPKGEFRRVFVDKSVKEDETHDDSKHDSISQNSENSSGFSDNTSQRENLKVSEDSKENIIVKIMTISTERSKTWKEFSVSNGSVIEVTNMASEESDL
eukprot:m.130229 g.130229  ORF g.130229 m.130229 type:complete len:879 (+) comp14600_c0_seq1:198-2834(+)